MGGDEGGPASPGGDESGEGSPHAGAETGADTEADLAEDADRLGFFGGDTLLPCGSLDAPSALQGGPPSPARTPRSPAPLPHHAHHGGHHDDGAASASSHDPHDSGEESSGLGEGRALPFEFRVLDAALDAVCSRLEDAVADVEAAAGPALDALAVRVTRRNLEDVKRVRGALAKLQSRVASVRGELQRLLDDDSDMRDMYLSRKAAARAAALRLWLGVRAGGAPHGAHHGHAPPATPHAHVWELADAGDDADIQELEDLLETYFAQVDHSASRLDVLKEFIQDTEDYVNIDLDSKRNKILEVNVLVGLAALVHAAGSCAYGVFGMNFLLDADGEPRGTLVPDPGGWHAGGFRAVAIAVAALSVLAWVAIVWGFRRDGFIHIIALPKLPLPTAADGRS